jgi:hypothetical protein
MDALERFELYRDACADNGNAPVAHKPRFTSQRDAHGKFKRVPIAVVQGEVVADPVPEIVRRYARGESMIDIAADMGVSKAILYRWLLAGVGDERYHDIVTQCLVRRVMDADESLDCAATPIEVARAREQARFARMDLERRRPKLYGAKPELFVAAAGPVVVLTRME